MNIQSDIEKKFAFVYFLQIHFEEVIHAIPPHPSPEIIMRTICTFFKLLLWDYFMNTMKSVKFFGRQVKYWLQLWVPLLFSLY